MDLPERSFDSYEGPIDLEVQRQNSLDNVLTPEHSNHAKFELAVSISRQIRALPTEVSDERAALQLLANMERLDDADRRDVLVTEVLSRKAFEDKARQILAARTRSGQVALVEIDVDYFKRVNDTAGHQVGDEVLKAVGETLVSHVRSYDDVARIGGDEFAVLVHTKPELRNLLSICHRIRESVPEVVERKLAALPDELRRRGSYLRTQTLSMGIAFADHPITLEELYGQADDAMYEVKRRRRNGVAYFDQTRGRAIYVYPDLTYQEPSPLVRLVDRFRSITSYIH